ncbi:PepSY domain-containing protein [Virgibacillus dakarensis]|uniref:PepSY domain-containing protein n=1 Tax=Virgibacillus dakarensis TaxID=1917889 RepID=UPI001356504A|nr:PepSY domain-containing protein [Virgibacillus dakarensis]MBT2218324.1 PepSY domain-containing protein [Virgibacillus dakarensis]
MLNKIGIMIGAVTGAAALGLGIYHSSASELAPELSIAQIKEIVSGQYPGTITDIELEEHASKAIYEVEINGDSKEYELHLDGKTGEILDLKEKMKLNASDPGDTEKAKDKANENKKTETNHQKQNIAVNEDKDQETDQHKEIRKQNTKQTPAISSKKAREIAKNEFNGTITDFELDEDDGRLIYEIEMEAGESEAEIEIDAYTGEIIVLSIDNDD